MAVNSVSMRSLRRNSEHTKCVKFTLRFFPFSIIVTLIFAPNFDCNYCFLAAFVIFN